MLLFICLFLSRFSIQFGHICLIFREQQALQTILAHAIEVNEKFQLAKQAQNYVVMTNNKNQYFFIINYVQPSEMDIEFELLLGSILSTKGLMKNVDLLSLPSKPALKKVNTITREEEKVERRPPSALKPTATIERKKNFTTSDPPKATPSDIEKERELARLRLEMLGFASSEEEEIIKDDNTFPLRTRMKDRPKSSKREKGKTSRPNSPRKVSNTNHPTEKPYLELIDPEKPSMLLAFLSKSYY